MTCPICANKAVAKYRPFCSKRCADLDLGNWLTGAYAVPSVDNDDEEELAQELQEEARKTH
ncbi:MAG: DNA gyrase inhibitor YacG [Marinosulfonomonas sp.]